MQTCKFIELGELSNPNACVHLARCPTEVLAELEVTLGLKLEHLASRERQGLPPTNFLLRRGMVERFVTEPTMKISPTSLSGPTALLHLGLHFCPPPPLVAGDS